MHVLKRKMFHVSGWGNGIFLSFFFVSVQQYDDPELYFEEVTGCSRRQVGAPDARLITTLGSGAEHQSADPCLWRGGGQHVVPVPRIAARSPVPGSAAQSRHGLERTHADHGLSTLRTPARMTRRRRDLFSDTR